MIEPMRVRSVREGPFLPLCHRLWLWHQAAWGRAMSSSKCSLPRSSCLVFRGHSRIVYRCLRSCRLGRDQSFPSFSSEKSTGALSSTGKLWPTTVQSRRATSIGSSSQATRCVPTLRLIRDGMSDSVEDAFEYVKKSLEAQEPDIVRTHPLSPYNAKRDSSGPKTLPGLQL